jgi:TusA-related sulfurtransferase
LKTVYRVQPGGINMKEIDARGLACPAPVLQTKAALQEESPNGVRVVVDNAASQQNVQRFLESQEFQTTHWNKSVLITLSSEIVIRCLLHSRNLFRKLHGDAKKIMVMCATDRLGFGDDAGPETDGQFPAHTKGNG